MPAPNDLTREKLPEPDDPSLLADRQVSLPKPKTWMSKKLRRCSDCGKVFRDHFREEFFNLEVDPDNPRYRELVQTMAIKFDDGGSEILTAPVLFDGFRVVQCGGAGDDVSCWSVVLKKSVVIGDD